MRQIEEERIGGIKVKCEANSQKLNERKKEGEQREIEDERTEESI